MRLLLRFLTVILCTLCRPALAQDPFELREGDRTLFLGDTFFEREGEYGSIEASLTAAFPDRNLTFRNLSWSAETPMGRARASFDWNKSEDDWLKRVKEQLGLVKPSVAFLNFGMTATLEGGANGVSRFKSEMIKLLDAIEEVSGEKVRFVLLGPIEREHFGRSAGPEATGNRDRWGTQADVDAHNQAASQYSRALRELADERQARYVPIDGAELHALAPSGPLTVNGIHLSPEGYQAFATVLLRKLGVASASGEPGAYQVLRSAVQRKNLEFFHRWRPANWTYLFGFRKQEQGQNAVEIPKFEPLVEQWDQRISKLRHLKNQDPATVSEVRSLLEARMTASGVERRPAPAQEQPRPTFDVFPGFEVSLWAEAPMLFKPIQMNWDPRGRLWVASSRVYPQIKPGEDPEDAVIVLEDVDGDGRAEKSTVFADGLLIPTSIVPDGKGGCYVGASHQLLHFADDDGDGHADRRTIVLSSFGTEDTHHNLHTLRWGFDGHIYMNQSIYTHTHVETPWGVRRLNSAGIWRLDPDTWQFEIFTKGGCNPWGHHWDQYGNHFFTDGAGFKGVYHAMEGATYFTYSDMRREAESISPGNYPKFCSLEVVHSPLFPPDWQDQVITCDFRAHRIVRFGLKESGSTFQTVEMPDLLRSTNVTFRPIDVRFGPDGALYIADWSNPIIQHGEVDFRDPRRDKEHGRIWRVAPKAERTFAKAPDLTSLATRELLSRTLSKNGWEQEQARLVLRQRDPDSVIPEANAWVVGQTDPRARLEVMWLYAAHERSTDALVKELAGAKDPRLRMAAAQQLAR